MACKQRPLEFEKLDQFSKIDTIKRVGNSILFRTDCFIVSNYKESLQSEKTVDSFVYKSRAKDIEKYEGYAIIVYKSSDKTSIKNFKTNPKDFDNYTFDNDQIYTYSWGRGKWFSKTKFKGRETVEAQPMIKEE